MLALELGCTATAGDTTAFLLQTALAPVRRGPLRLAFTWSYAAVRGSAGQEFGFGDPRVYMQLRLAGGTESPARLAVEGMARIPTADAGLFPYATGGQELELSGSLTLGRARGILLGGGYVWSEPPADSGLGTTDVPHAAHAFAALTRRLADWALRVRGDGLWMEEHRARAQVEFSVSRWSGTGLRPGLAAGVEVGGRAERVADAWGTLRFAMPLR